MNGEWIDVSGPNPSPSRTRVPGPTLRQDTPQPPLRYLMLHTWRRTRQRLAAMQILLRRAADHAHARAARTMAWTIARLDAHVWQPAMWPFRPAQREMLARAVAALSVAIVALGWVVAYSALAPTEAVRPPASPKAPLEKSTARVVPHALPEAKPPVVETPSPDPAPAPRPPQR